MSESLEKPSAGADVGFLLEPPDMSLLVFVANLIRYRGNKTKAFFAAFPESCREMSKEQVNVAACRFYAGFKKTDMQAAYNFLLDNDERFGKKALELMVQDAIDKLDEISVTGDVKEKIQAAKTKGALALEFMKFKYPNIVDQGDALKKIAEAVVLVTELQKVGMNMKMPPPPDRKDVIIEKQN